MLQGERKEWIAIVKPVVKSVVHWYSRRVWWMDRDDLYQEGWITALECLEYYDLDESMITGYVQRAVSKRLSRYCWELSCPLSDSKAGKHLAGIHRKAISTEGSYILASVRSMPKAFTLIDGGRDPEMEMLKREAELLVPHLQQQLRKRIVQIYDQASSNPVPNPVLDGVLKVLIDGFPPVQAAQVTGADVKELYMTTEWMKKLASADRIVRLLAANIEDRRRDLQ